MTELCTFPVTDTFDQLLSTYTDVYFSTIHYLFDVCIQRACVIMSECTPGTRSLYNNIDLGQSHDRVCVGCPQGTFTATNHTRTTCIAHANCPAGNFETGVGTRTSDTQCSPWSLCQIGQYDHSRLACLRQLLGTRERVCVCACL